MNDLENPPIEKIMFCGEEYSLQQYSDGSKRIFKEKNARGFKMNIKVSGDPEDHKEGMQALKDFYKQII